MFGRDFRVQLELMLPPLMKIWMQPLRLITSSTMLSHLLIAPEPEHSLHFVYASILFKMTSCWVPMESIQHYLMVYLWYHQLPLESSTIHHPLVPYQAVSNGNVPWFPELPIVLYFSRLPSYFFPLGSVNSSSLSHRPATSWRASSSLASLVALRPPLLIAFTLVSLTALLIITNVSSSSSVLIHYCMVVRIHLQTLDTVPRAPLPGQGICIGVQSPCPCSIFQWKGAKRSIHLATWPVGFLMFFNHRKNPWSDLNNTSDPTRYCL